MSGDEAERQLWRRLFAVRSGDDVASIGLDVRPLATAPHLMRVVGSSAFLNTRSTDGAICGVFWADSAGAMLRVVARLIEEDDGPSGVEPPPWLLPAGSDRSGSFATVKAAVRSRLGVANESAAYRIMTDGAFLYREIAGGRSGFSFRYRSLEGDADPVAVIGVALPRDDWQPDRAALVSLDP